MQDAKALVKQLSYQDMNTEAMQKIISSAAEKDYNQAIELNLSKCGSL